MAVFQVRSSQRDRQTDKERVSAIADAIEAAIISAERERAALVIRVRDAQDLAAFTAGNNSDEYLTREPEEARMLAGYEKQLIAGHKRIEELNTHVASLNAVRELCRTRFQDGTI